MKVIAEKNNNPQLPRMQVSCTGQGFSRDGKGCGRLLEITPVDVRSGTSHDYGGGSDTYYFIICPCCGHKTEVYASEMKNDFRALI